MAKPTKKPIVPNLPNPSQNLEIPAQNSIEEKVNNVKKENWKDTLLLLTEIHYGHIGHYQNQRSVISNILVLSYAAILAFISFDKSIDYLDYPLILVLMTLGIFGVIISWKYYERTVLLHKMYEAYRDALSEKVLEDPVFLKKLENETEEKHTNEYWYFTKTRIWEFLRVSSLWMLFHGIVFGLGSYLLYRSLYYPIIPTDSQQSVYTSRPASTPAPPIQTPTLNPTVSPSSTTTPPVTLTPSPKRPANRVR